MQSLRTLAVGISTVCGRCRILCAPLNYMVSTLFFYALRSIISCFHVLDYWHKASTTRSRTSVERTCNCLIGSCRGTKFQCNFSAERVRWEAMEWSDKGGWLLVWVWVVCGGLKVSDHITGSVYHVSGPASSLFLSLKGNEKSATGPPIGCQVAPSYPVVHLLKVVSVVCGPRICNPWQNEVGPALEKARQCRECSLLLVQLEFISQLQCPVSHNVLGLVQGVTRQSAVQVI